MSYNYQTQKQNLFTEQGQVFFLKVRDAAHALIKQAGAFRFDHVRVEGVHYSWDMLAAIDRLVELGELVELPRQCWGQFRVFTTPQTHNA